MGPLKAAACCLPLFAGLAMGFLGIADWSLWGPDPRDALPFLWRCIDWLMFPFVLAGVPLLAPTAWIWSLLSPLASRLSGPTASQDSGFYILLPCLLFGLYLGIRSRWCSPDVTLRASSAGSLVIILFALLSALAVRGSGDGQAAVVLVMGQNGGLMAGALVAEWVLRRPVGSSAS